MTKLEATKARSDFADTLNRVAFGHERIVLSRRGKLLAALVPVQDLERLERLAREEEDRLDNEAADAALREKAPHVTWKAVKVRHGMK